MRAYKCPSRLCALYGECPLSHLIPVSEQSEPDEDTGEILYFAVCDEMGDTFCDLHCADLVENSCAHGSQGIMTLDDLNTAEERRHKELKEHITAEANREISAKAPKRTRKFGHEGNGMKGPKTKMMAKQKAAFFAFLERHPESKEHSRISRAHELWLKHPEWERARMAQGEAKGYSSHKALSAAK